MGIKKFVIVIIFFFAYLTVWSQANDSRIQLADPTIFYHAGTYYLYGTGAKQYASGFVVYTSKDLKNWDGPRGINEGFALKKGDAYGTEKFWAPQVFYKNNKFYMAYTANEHIAIASSSSPLGPFAQEDKSNLIKDKKQIDPYVFIDDDGKKYLYHVVVANDANKILVAEMEDDLSAVKMETLRECITATENWENTEKEKWSVTEGPTVIKNKDTYYLIYSANHFKSKDYAVGYATSKSPLGPWIKFTGSPIISRGNIGKNGVGHGDMFKDEKGKWKYVFHAHYSENSVSPRVTAIVDVAFKKGKENEDQIKVKSKTFYFLHKR